MTAEKSVTSSQAAGWLTVWDCSVVFRKHIQHVFGLLASNQLLGVEFLPNVAPIGDKRAGPSAIGARCLWHASAVRVVEVSIPTISKPNLLLEHVLHQ